MNLRLKRILLRVGRRPYIDCIVDYRSDHKLCSVDTGCAYEE